MKSISFLSLGLAFALLGSMHMRACESGDAAGKDKLAIAPANQSPPTTPPAAAPADDDIAEIVTAPQVDLRTRLRPATPDVLQALSLDTTALKHAEGELPEKDKAKLCALILAKQEDDVTWHISADGSRKPANLPEGLEAYLPEGYDTEIIDNLQATGIKLKEEKRREIWLRNALEENAKTEAQLSSLAAEEAELKAKLEQNKRKTASALNTQKEARAVAYEFAPKRTWSSTLTFGLLS